MTIPRQRKTVLRTHAFTLVELLVVIFIIAILSGLLMTALSRANKSARLANCQSNQKQTGGMASVYQNDHNQRAPAVYRRYLPGMTNKHNYKGWVWSRTIGTPDVLFCPLEGSIDQPESDVSKPDSLDWWEDSDEWKLGNTELSIETSVSYQFRGAYAMDNNNDLIKAGGGDPMRLMPRGSLYADCGNLGLSVCGLYHKMADSPDSESDMDDAMSSGATHHENGFAVGYGDGSSKFILWDPEFDDHGRRLINLALFSMFDRTKPIMCSEATPTNPCSGAGVERKHTNFKNDWDDTKFTSAKLGEVFR